MDRLLEEALLDGINTEKKSYTFYMMMAGLVKDIETKKVFEHLAVEEAEHLKRLVDCYPSDFCELVEVLEQPDDNHAEIFREYMNKADEYISVKEALEISLREEKDCIDRYSIFVNTIKLPQIKDVFELNLNETFNHYDLISKEYMRVTGNSKVQLVGSG